MNDSFAILHEMLNNCEIFTNSSGLMKQLDLTKKYLKYGFEKKIIADLSIDVPLHNDGMEDNEFDQQRCILLKIQFALVPTTRNCIHCMHLCKCCLSVFQLFYNLKSCLRDGEHKESNAKVIDGCSQKAKLLLAHKI